MKFAVPEEVKDIAGALVRAGFEAYLVGGCVRDLLLEREPNDWDIATNAKPEEVQKLFADSVYENQFGTVGVKTQSAERKLQIVEVTTFRLEGKYTDKRHPDEIKFAKTIEEDLSRRDFTINALALDLQSAKRKAQSDDDSRFAISESLIVDPFGGQDDLKNKIVRTVGNPEERFREDALRLMRAVRLAVELDDFSARGPLRHSFSEASVYLRRFVHENEPGDVPDFRREIAVAADFVFGDDRIVPRRGAGDERHPYGVGAVGVRDAQGINDIAARLGHFLPVFIADDAVEIDGSKRDFAGAV